jgi:hypothetical protein
VKPKDPMMVDIDGSETDKMQSIARSLNVVAMSAYYEQLGCPNPLSMRLGDVYRIPVRSKATLSLSTGLPLPSSPQFHEFEVNEWRTPSGNTVRIWRKRDFI